MDWCEPDPRSPQASAAAKARLRPLGTRLSVNGRGEPPGRQTECRCATQFPSHTGQATSSLGRIGDAGVKRRHGLVTIPPGSALLVVGRGRDPSVAGGGVGHVEAGAPTADRGASVRVPALAPG